MSLGASRGAIGAARDDPLQPLRAMADRVGKEVEKFAERVDYWHTYGHDDPRTKYQNTLRMVGKFKDIAETTVKDLRKQSEAENQGELNKSVRRRIQTMTEMDPMGSGNATENPFPSIVPSIELGPGQSSSSVQDLRQWQAELATWELLRIIIEHHHPEPGFDVAADKRSRLAKVGGAYRYSPNHEIWNRFLLEDNQAKEKELILRWLENTAKNSESDIESITAQLEVESGKGTNTWTSGWLDTKSSIKQAKRLHSLHDPMKPEMTVKTNDRAHDMINQLDPDAPSRQKRTLEKSDEYYERALWMVCYEMLRRGVSWAKISEWCKERNEAWRGVSIGAANEPHPGAGPNLTGSTVGYLFRRTCFYAARGARFPYEGAVYGLLSGDLKEVEPVCRSWDDHLYARYNALLLSRFDGYLLQNYPQKIPPTIAQQFAFQDAVTNIGNWETSSSEVIGLLKQYKPTAVQSLSPMRLIQGHIISQTMDELVYNVGLAATRLFRDESRPTSLIEDLEVSVSESQPRLPREGESTLVEKHYQSLATNPHALRALVHIFIVLRKGLGMFDMDNSARWTAIDNVIASYIEILRIGKKIQLIPLYAAQLDGERPVRCLAHILPDIKNFEEQSNTIGLMVQYRIDPVLVISQNFFNTLERGYVGREGERISKLNILEPKSEQNYLWPGHRIRNDFSGLEIKAREASLIDALKWYIHLERDLSDTFTHLDTGLVHLLLNGQIGAATELVNEMSLETLSHIKTQTYCGYGFDFTIPGSEFQDETQVTLLASRSPPSSGRGPIRPSDIPSPEEHYELVKSFREGTQTYQHLQNIVRVLALFREWHGEEENLIEQRNHGSVKVSLKRAKEIFEQIEATVEAILEGSTQSYEDPLFWAVQKAYIPEILIAYISVVQAGSFFWSRELAIKAMDLATIIADNERQWLQRVFLETGRMSELVETLALFSRAMLSLGEHDDKKRASGKKRGSRGETLRIWDLHVRN